MLGIVATSLTIATDLSLLVVISFGLFLIQPTIAVTSLAFFSLLGITLHKFMGKRARELGKKNWELSVSSDELLVTAVDSYRYLSVSNRMSNLLRKLSSLRMELADVSAEMQFLPNISKYVFESSVIIGALLISAVQFIVLDANHAVASLAIFLAAASRLAPAALRIQQGAITIRNSLGSTGLSYLLISELKEVSFQKSHENPLNPNHDDFKPFVQLDNVSFNYPNVSGQVLNGINCSITEGQFVAIIGPSGSGKTTLVDLILGLLEPDTGRIQISGTSPQDATQRWPGAIAYVPQNIDLLNGTLKDNICLGYEANEIANQHLLNVLEMVQLTTLVQSFPNGIDTNLGDRGLQLSGGQKQRLGIARALLSNPALLILDEATSSLDNQTEKDINESIAKLKGKTTIIAIAHRLSTLKSADKIIYVGKNVFFEADSFEAIKNQVPDSQNFMIDL
jgi:ABC-type multidrug transport system fused ATPase/permease subunit